MVITDITVTKRGRYSLFVDGEFLFSVDGQTVLEYGLKKGLEVDCGFLDELQSACLEKKARDKAMDLLSRRPCAPPCAPPCGTQASLTTGPLPGSCVRSTASFAGTPPGALSRSCTSVALTGS